MADGGVVLPHSNEAEMSVLGAMLLEPDAVGAVSAILLPEDFHGDAHRLIYETILRLESEHVSVDLVTVTASLERQGRLTDAGGRTYLVELLDVLPSAANAEHYARIVREKSVRRRLISAAEGIRQEALGSDATAPEILDRAETSVFEIGERESATGTIPIGRILEKTFDRLEKLQETRGALTGLDTGYFRLNDMTGGLQKGDLIVVAARPSMGKTTFALNLALNCCLERESKILFMSLEMSEEQIAQNCLCARADVDANKVRKGQLSERDWSKLQDAAGRLHNSPFLIDATPGLTPMAIRTKARRVKKRLGDLDLVVVDYLQMVAPPPRADNRQQEISVISRSLKELAREVSCPVIALSQLNRSVDSREDHRPRLSDLRECVVGETLVVLADGRRIPIRELVGTNPRVLSWSQAGEVVPAEAERVWRVGMRPVSRIRLASGRTIIATARHRLLGPRGWVRIGDFGPGDRLALARRILPPESPKSVDRHQIVLLAHLIGDGSYLAHQPLRYTTASEDNSRVVTDAASRLGSVVRRVAGKGARHRLVISGNGNRWHPAGVGKWLKDLGVFGQRPHQKRIPPVVFQLDDAGVALFLRHIWAADGCIHTRSRESRGAHRVFFPTCSRGLAEDVAALLLRFEIVGRLRTVKSPSSRPMYSVEVSGSRDQSSFLDLVGTFGPRDQPGAQLRCALSADSRKGPGTNVDSLPRECSDTIRQAMKRQGVTQRMTARLRGTGYGGAAHFAAILSLPEVNEACSAPVFWDRVVSIEPAGEREVFDLTVPGPDSWIADGIISHNSGAIEQDADLIMFLYREDYYKGESLPPGEGSLTEVILAKQRNGPTGKVELMFFPHKLRFTNAAAEGA